MGSRRGRGSGEVLACVSDPHGAHGEQGTQSHPEDQAAPHTVGPALGSHGAAPVSQVVLASGV